MSAKVLVAASTQSRGKELLEALSLVRGPVDVVIGNQRPKSWGSYRLLVCDLGPKLPSAKPLLDNIRDDAHVVLIVPKLSVGIVADYMRDPRINHLITQPVDTTTIRSVVDKLATGSIFGIERYLPDEATIAYQRFTSFASRCKSIEDLEDTLQKKRVRSNLRRAAIQVVEELLMNAMYQAPIDENGQRVFADVEPRARVKKRTPRPVSLRYAIAGKNLYLSVRDRFGSFQRKDLASYLLRCTTADVQIENKKLGAGLGLYLIASTASRLIINLLPGNVSEFIVVLEPPPANGGSTMRMFSYTEQRPKSSKFTEIEADPASNTGDIAPMEF